MFVTRWWRAVAALLLLLIVCTTHGAYVTGQTTVLQRCQNPPSGQCVESADVYQVIAWEGIGSGPFPLPLGNLIGVHFGISSQEYLLLGHSNGLTIYNHTGNGVLTPLWNYATPCLSLFPTAIVNDYAIVVGGAHERCQCASKTNSCQPPALKLSLANGTSYFVPVGPANRVTPFQYRPDTTAPFVPTEPILACNGFLNNTDQAIGAVTYTPGFGCYWQVTVDTVNAATNFSTAAIIIATQTRQALHTFQSVLPVADVAQPDIQPFIASGLQYNASFGANIVMPNINIPGDVPHGVVTVGPLSALSSGGTLQVTKDTSFGKDFQGVWYDEIRRHLWLKGNAPDDVFRITILDVSNPTSPQAITHNIPSIPFQGFHIVSFIQQATKIFAVCRYGMPVNVPSVPLVSSFDIWDVTDLTSPVKTDFIPFVFGSPYYHAVHNNVVYAVNGTAGEIVYFTLTNTGTLATSAKLNETFSQVTLTVLDMYVVGSSLFVAKALDGVSVWDLSTSPPTLASTFLTLTSAQRSITNLVYGAGAFARRYSVSSDALFFGNFVPTTGVVTSVLQGEVRSLVSGGTTSTTDSTITASASTTAATTSSSATTSLTSSSSSSSTSAAQISSTTSETTSNDVRYQVFRFTFGSSSALTVTDIEALINSAGGDANEWLILEVVAGREFVASAPNTSVSAAEATTLRSGIEQQSTFTDNDGRATLRTDQRDPSSGAMTLVLAALPLVSAVVTTAVAA